MDKITPYLKTVFGFLTPGAVILGSAVTEASDGGANVTQAEWITALVACIITGSLVFAVPNKDPRGTHQDDSVQPARHRDEFGESAVAIALIVLVVVVIVVLLVPAIGR